MKVICIHHRLAGLTSHHFNEAQGFIQEFARRGREFLLLISLHASPQLAAELQARAVFDDPTYHMAWSFDERSRRFADMLHAQVDPELTADDWVLSTISTQVEAHALTCWLRELPRAARPWIVIHMGADRWNRAGREEYERQMAEFGLLRAAIASLSPEEARRLIFCTQTPLLSEELGGLLDTPVAVAPMMLELGRAGLTGTAAPKPQRPRVSVLGGTRREKGSHRIPAIIRACQSLVPVAFQVHLANNSLTTEEAASLAQVAEEPHVTVIREPMSLPEYNAALKSADIGLFPYDVIPYRKRTSGVFAEHAAQGKPVVAPRGTWMAAQIEAGRAAGTIFEDLQPGTIAQAIARCVADLERLTQSARALSLAWRQTAGAAAFVDFVEAQIARRS